MCLCAFFVFCLCDVVCFGVVLLWCVFVCVLCIHVCLCVLFVKYCVLLYAVICLWFFLSGFNVFVIFHDVVCDVVWLVLCCSCLN